MVRRLLTLLLLCTPAQAQPSDWVDVPAYRQPIQVQLYDDPITQRQNQQALDQQQLAATLAAMDRAHQAYLAELQAQADLTQTITQAYAHMTPAQRQAFALWYKHWQEQNKNH